MYLRVFYFCFVFMSLSNEHDLDQDQVDFEIISGLRDDHLQTSPRSLPFSVKIPEQISGYLKVQYLEVEVNL